MTVKIVVRVSSPVVPQARTASGCGADHQPCCCSIAAVALSPPGKRGVVLIECSGGATVSVLYGMPVRRNGVSSVHSWHVVGKNQLVSNTTSNRRSRRSRSGGTHRPGSALVYLLSVCQCDLKMTFLRNRRSMALLPVLNKIRRGEFRAAAAGFCHRMYTAFSLYSHILSGKLGPTWCCCPC